MCKVLKIALEKVSYEADKLYGYAPLEGFDYAIGQRVIVPFGRGNAKHIGIILDISYENSAENLKEIFSVVDISPLVNAEMVELIKWMKERYFCTYFDVVHLIFPSGIGTGVDGIKYIFRFDEIAPNLSDLEYKFLDKLKSFNRDTLSLKLISSLKIPNYTSILSSMIEKGVVKEILQSEATVGQKNINVFSVKSGIERKLSFFKSEKQLAVCEFLTKNPRKTLNEINYYTGVSPSVVKGLVKKGILVCEKTRKYFSPYFESGDREQASKKDVILNEEQQSVYNGIVEENKSQVSLLYGITGSGKTSVLIKLIDHTLSLGKTSIFMVPEIALTTQFVNVFRARYGEKVAVIHSALTDWQRYDIWRRIRDGNIKIVVGTRSAVFAPLENIGLIVVDEEHEFTYKSEFAPRYDTREVALHRCLANGGKLVLSSATPSIESYYRAVSGRYNLYELKRRYGKHSLPDVRIIDMNGNHQIGELNLLSDQLIEELKLNLKNGNQSILLLNRRGFNSFAKCMECSQIVQCPNCSVSLSYHKDNNRLMCHCCGYSVPKISKCQNCGKDRVVYFGSGTQKLESVLSEKIPGVKILRIDSDVKNCKNSLNSYIKDFEDGKYDILLGTQMVAKGFNFPNVTLVGVLSVDNFLYDGDFRSLEKTFSLITQVVGRAGRMKNGSKAFIQTFAPENEVIQMSSKQDFVAFYNDEIKLRKLMLNPPFCDICIVGFTGKNESEVMSGAKKFFDLLRKNASECYRSIPLRIYPPTEFRIKLLSKKYRYKIIIKCKNDKIFREFMDKTLREYCSKSNRSVSAYVSINPDTIL